MDTNSAFVPFFTSTNLANTELTKAAPWQFTPEPHRLKHMRCMPKKDRVAYMASETANWNVYSAVGGLAPNLRVSGTNPATELRGFVADYDMEIDLSTVKKCL